MVDYKNGKIYKIVSDKTNLIYIGSTCNTLSRRHSGHKSKYNCFLNEKGNYVSSFELMKLGDTKIILIEDCPCERKEQLLARERHFIESLDCSNKSVPGRTYKEWKNDNKEKLSKKDKEYRQKNKKQISEKGKEWRQENKEKIIEQGKEYRENNRDSIKEYYNMNKEKINEQRKIKIACDKCGTTLRKNDMARHKRSNHCKNFKVI